MDGIRIQPMTVDDLDQVMEIERKSFISPWSREAFTNELRKNRFAHYLVAKAGDKVIAYGGMWFILDEAHITNIAVHPDYRGRGIGTLLLEEMIKYGTSRGMDGFTLEVRKSNSSAIKLYKKAGFLECGTRKGYYSDTGEDALIMWLRL